MKKYYLASVKVQRAIECETDAEAIEKAKAMMKEYRPAFGVQVEYQGEEIYDSEEDAE